ncbi:peptidase inhibitor family I36 protein [Actinoallomurus sp. CA-150999]|uniref:peptidase inhibitor family I36 protein n=1 Tax=Actinoallomurus sp. CA-150999 TaxID=3239887 RepID=UPI003D8E693D
MGRRKLLSVAVGTAAATLFMVPSASASADATKTIRGDGYTLTVSPEGSADAQSATCRMTAICLWNKKNYKGTKYTLTAHNRRCVTFHGAINDHVRSLIVGTYVTGAPLRLWQKMGCRGYGSKQHPTNSRSGNVNEYVHGHQLGWSAFGIAADQG